MSQERIARPLHGGTSPRRANPSPFVHLDAQVDPYPPTFGQPNRSVSERITAELVPPKPPFAPSGNSPVMEPIITNATPRGGEKPQLDVTRLVRVLDLLSRLPYEAHAKSDLRGGANVLAAATVEGGQK